MMIMQDYTCRDALIDHAAGTMQCNILQTDLPKCRTTNSLVSFNGSSYELNYISHDNSEILYSGNIDVQHELLQLLGTTNFSIYYEEEASGFPWYIDDDGEISVNGSEFIVDGTVELELSDAADDTVEDYYEIVFEDQELYPTAITGGL